MALGLTVLSPLSAADIYRWTDEDGRTHFSDVVPKKYRKSAVKVESRKDPTEAQRKEAEARAAKDKEMVSESEKRKADAAGSAPSPPAPTPASKPAVDGNADCATLHRLYKESLDCFAPYITAAGTTRAEAFQNCTSVPDPAPKCGPPK